MPEEGCIIVPSYAMGGTDLPFTVAVPYHTIGALEATIRHGVICQLPYSKAADSR